MAYRLALVQSVHDIPKDQWDTCLGSDYPFLQYAFIAALEDSGVTHADTGWQPLHITLYEGDTLLAIAPSYIKTHSYGEYVFDWAWADAYQQRGLDYYPKLLTAVPFSPVTGPRILTQQPLNEVVPWLAEGATAFCEQQGFSSWHTLFPTQAEAEALSDADLHIRLGSQYHWFNEGYSHFDDFLARFTSRKRKSVKRERRKVAEQGVTIRCVEGNHIDKTLLDSFYHCYHLTYLKRGRQGYLNKAFFANLLENMADQLVLLVATYDEQTVACALCFKDSTTLYGRYWGCLDNFDSLHFETCYYTGIEYCIEQGLQRFDPGAQGEHKIQRGFQPIETWSSHFIAHPGFDGAVGKFVEQEKQAMQEQIKELTTWLPFRCED
ncbi:GNAT family N-acetyltransferase [Neptunomonas sp. XY-337]|uniref:GNAT family N-acetyltransferase n=1 Tax=Neptunomonas sp. XY-337 TaxID=2561897 RepID=UPI0010AA2B22|nr:GNAT family N-acetyltransferase [Neptunomonas sp. XY-337]